MSKKNINSEILIRDYLDGTITEANFRLLESRLSRDVGTRKMLRHLAAIEEGIADFVEANKAVEKPVQTPLEITPKKIGTATGFGPWVRWALATAACICLLLTLRESDLPDSGTGIDEVGISTDVEENLTYVARLIDAVDVRFENEDLDTTSGFSTGDYFLQNGSIQFRFQNGADMVVQSPARFSILSDNNIVLHDGNLRASFPPAARGFRVGTPGVEYHDLGTEFGVYANSQEKHSELHVFQGRVNSVLLGEADNLETFNAGQAVIYRDGISQNTNFNESTFLVPGSLGFKRWQRNQIFFRNQEGLIGYFPFYQTLNGSLHNHASGEERLAGMPVTARVGDAYWASGRWYEKQSLFFNRPDDYAEVNIPGTYKELSFAVWVKINSLKNSYSAILNSNGWAEGDVHWQLDRRGGCWVAGSGTYETRKFETVPLGQWVHLVATISTLTEECKVYANGTLMSTGKIDSDSLLRPGVCRMGNWIDNEADQTFGLPSSKRGIDGWIDEFMIWDRLLKPEEIQRLSVLGRPSAIWGSQ